VTYQKSLDLSSVSVSPGGSFSSLAGDEHHGGDLLRRELLHLTLVRPSLASRSGGGDESGPR
jgi:hypothetical protein